MTKTENKNQTKQLLDTNASSTPSVEFTYRDLEDAARSGNVETLQWLVEQDKCGIKLNQRILQSAVWSLKTADIPQWLTDQSRKLNKDIFDKDFLDLVAFAGKLNVVRWSIDHGVKPDMETLNSAACGGHLEVLQFLIKQGLEPNSKTLDDAAESGSLETVKWLVEQYSELKPNQETLNIAAGSRGLELVQWLVAHGDEFGLKPDQDTVDRAAGYERNWDVLLWLIEQGLKPDIEILREATSQCEWYMVQSLIERDAVRPTQRILNGAMSRGDSHIVEKPDQETLSAAIKNIDWEEVQWLIEDQGVKPTQETLDRAAGFGNLYIVQWLVGQCSKFGIKPNQDTLNDAAAFGELDTVQWLVDQGLTPNEETLRAAACNGMLKTMQLFVELGFKPSQWTLHWAAMSGRWKMAQWLVEEQRITPRQETVKLMMDFLVGLNDTFDMIED